jgi:Protein of unknown function, DUF488
MSEPCRVRRQAGITRSSPIRALVDVDRTQPQPIEGFAQGLVRVSSETRPADHFLAGGGDHRELIEKLRDRAKKGRVTIVYAARDQEHNNAAVLAELLRDG